MSIEYDSNVSFSFKETCFTYWWNREAPFDYLEPIQPKISIETKYSKYFNESVESIDFYDIFLTQGASLIHSHKTNSDPF